MNMFALPKFRRFPDGRLILAYTREASAVMKRKDSPNEVSL